MLHKLNEISPHLHGHRIFIAPSAELIGNIILEEDSSIWFNVTVRGDIEPIDIGECSNIQDGSSIHTDTGFPTQIGKNVTIGHNCVIHGCTIGEGSLIGMGSVILSGATIGKNCLIGGGSLITGNMHIPDGMLALGSPARIIKALDDEAIANNHRNTKNYVERKNQYLSEGMGSPTEQINENTKICKIKPENWKTHKETIRSYVRKPKYICVKCFRVSSGKKQLCQPKKIK